MKDRVIKAYMASVDVNLRIPFMESETTKDGLKVIASVYKDVASKRYYSVAVIVNNGEYLFEDVASYSRYYTAEEVLRRDIPQETIGEIVQNLVFRKKLLAYIGSNPKLPSVLSVAYNKNLIIYYAKESKLRTARLDNDQLVINLPPQEQVYLTDLLEQFNIKVRRIAEEAPYEYRLK
ncbi:hypothetical protein [Lysinibacillus xylanilyticus]|uniref:hypothetical protein n=1 Tax=Lysinibacillus xylanilyticus TaxID=582475 RepID=UPI0036DBD00B